METHEVVPSSLPGLVVSGDQFVDALNSDDKTASGTANYPRGIADDAPEEARAAHQVVVDLKGDIDSAYMRFSEALWVLYDRSLYRVLGFNDFRDYVESAIDFKLRKAQYLVQIWAWVKDLLPETRQKLMAIGWSKMKELVGIVNDDNVDEWVARALSMNVVSLAEAARQHLTNGASNNPATGQTPDSEWKNMTFRLAPAQYEIISKALEVAGGIAQSDKKGHLLELICTDFLSSNTAGSDDDARQQFFRRIESTTGGRLVVMTNDLNQVVYGADLVQALVEQSSQ